MHTIRSFVNKKRFLGSGWVSWRKLLDCQGAISKHARKQGKVGLGCVLCDMSGKFGIYNAGVIVYLKGGDI
jgi:hypothetical protein